MYVFAERMLTDSGDSPRVVSINSQEIADSTMEPVVLLLGDQIERQKGIGVLGRVLS